MLAEYLLFSIWTAYLVVLVASMGFAAAYSQRYRTTLNARKTSKRVRTEVGVIVPAFNEARHIEKCISSVLSSDIDITEIIIVDDGSIDDTAQKAKRILQDHSCGSVIRLNRNCGKAHALNRALEEFDGPRVFTLDADSYVEPSTISHAVSALEAHLLDAVACHIVVAKDQTFINAVQAVEYEGSLQLERLMQAELGIITTVPGAGGLYKTEAIRSAGGFLARSLSEDTDLTLSLQRKRFHIGAAMDSIVWTVPPDSLLDLLKQRERWIWGNLGAANHHLLSAEKAHTKFYALMLPYFLIMNAASPVVFLLVLILTPLALFSGSGLIVPLGTTALTIAAIIRCKVAFTISDCKQPPLAQTILSVVVFPLISCIASATGLVRRLTRLGNHN